MTWIATGIMHDVDMEEQFYLDLTVANMCSESSNRSKAGK